MINVSLLVNNIITHDECLKIVVAKFMGDRFEYQGKQVVPIDVDTKCECNCIIKPSVI